MLKKVLLNCCLLFTVILTFTACSPAIKDPALDSSDQLEEKESLQKKPPAEGNVQELLFPASMEGKTEANAKIYEITPFHLKVTFPEGWKTEEEKPNPAPYPFRPGFSNYLIENEKGEVVGVVGYNTYELYEGAEDNPMAIYGDIDKGVHYCFQVQDTYQVIKKQDYGETALVNVYYSEGLEKDAQGNNVEKGRKDNIGILLNDKSRLVYVAFDFESDKVTQDQAKAIAESLLIED